MQAVRSKKASLWNPSLPVLKINKSVIPLFFMPRVVINMLCEFLLGVLLLELEPVLLLRISQWGYVHSCTYAVALFLGKLHYLRVRMP